MALPRITNFADLKREVEAVNTQVARYRKNYQEVVLGEELVFAEKPHEEEFLGFEHDVSMLHRTIQPRASADATDFAGYVTRFNEIERKKAAVFLKLDIQIARGQIDNYKDSLDEYLDEDKINGETYAALMDKITALKNAATDAHLVTAENLLQVNQQIEAFRQELIAEVPENDEDSDEEDDDEEENLLQKARDDLTRAGAELTIAKEKAAAAQRAKTEAEAKAARANATTSRLEEQNSAANVAQAEAEAEAVQAEAAKTAAEAKIPAAEADKAAKETAAAAAGATPEAKTAATEAQRKLEAIKTAATESASLALQARKKADEAATLATETETKNTAPLAAAKSEAAEATAAVAAAATELAAAEKQITKASTEKDEAEESIKTAEPLTDQHFSSVSENLHTKYLKLLKIYQDLTESAEFSIADKREIERIERVTREIKIALKRFLTTLGEKYHSAQNPDDKKKYKKLYDSEENLGLLAKVEEIENKIREIKDKQISELAYHGLNAGFADDYQAAKREIDRHFSTRMAPFAGGGIEAGEGKTTRLFDNAKPKEVRYITSEIATQDNNPLLTGTIHVHKDGVFRADFYFDDIAKFANVKKGGFFSNLLGRDDMPPDEVFKWVAEQVKNFRDACPYPDKALKIRAGGMPEIVVKALVLYCRYYNINLAPTGMVEKYQLTDKERQKLDMALPAIKEQLGARKGAVTCSQEARTKMEEEVLRTNTLQA